MKCDDSYIKMRISFTEVTKNIFLDSSSSMGLSYLRWRNLVIQDLIQTIEESKKEVNQLWSIWRIN